MHKNFYHQNEKFIDITWPKFLVIIITVLMFFVLPAQLIGTYKEDPQKITAFLYDIGIKKDSKINTIQAADSSNESREGRVAGASTDRAIANVASGQGINIKNRGTQFTLLGGFFIMISLISTAYLLLDKKKDEKY